MTWGQLLLAVVVGIVVFDVLLVAWLTFAAWRRGWEPWR